MMEVQGLEGVKYQDNLQQRQECAGSDAAIQVDREVDRIYLQTPGKLQVGRGPLEWGPDGSKRDTPCQPGFCALSDVRSHCTGAAGQQRGQSICRRPASCRWLQIPMVVLQPGLLPSAACCFGP